jgi:hypothetical protein
MKKEGKNPSKIERDRLVKICAEKKIEVKRDGRTVKQQVDNLKKTISKRGLTV